MTVIALIMAIIVGFSHIKSMRTHIFSSRSETRSKLYESLEELKKNIHEQGTKSKEDVDLAVMISVMTIVALQVLFSIIYWITVGSMMGSSLILAWSALMVVYSVRSFILSYRVMKGTKFEGVPFYDRVIFIINIVVNILFVIFLLS